MTANAYDLLQVAKNLLTNERKFISSFIESLCSSLFIADANPLGIDMAF
jgi:hypothetical protein